MIVEKNKTSLLLDFRVISDVGVPITGILYTDGDFEAGYLLPGGSDWVDLTLVNATFGIYTSSGMIQNPDADGYYQLGVPDAAHVEGGRTSWRFKKGTNGYRYGAIDYVSLPESLITDQADINFNFSVPGSPVNVSSSSPIYIKELNKVIQFTADVDITAIPLTVIFEDADKLDTYIITDGSLVKVGTDVTATLPSGFTDEVVSFNWAIRHETDLTVYGTGSISVVYAPHEDV